LRAGEEDHREVLPLGEAADAGEEGEAVDLGYHVVEQDQVDAAVRLLTLFPSLGF
jgi:hypothetical protein